LQRPKSETSPECSIRFVDYWCQLGGMVEVMNFCSASEASLLVRSLRSGDALGCWNNTQLAVERVVARVCGGM
jgi:hypothetical protein